MGREELLKKVVGHTITDIREETLGALVIELDNGELLAIGMTVRINIVPKPPTDPKAGG